MRLYERLAILAIILLPFEFALTLPEMFPITRLSEITSILAIVAFVASARGRDRKRAGADLFWLSLLAIGVVLSMGATLFRETPPERFRQFMLSAEFDVFWMTARALIVVGLYLTIRSVRVGLLASGLRIAGWVTFSGVVVQQVGLALGMSRILELAGFNVTSSGVLVVDAADSVARSGTFSNGQELGFVAGALLIVAIINRTYWLAASLLYCVAYSQSTGAFLALGVAILLLVLVTGSTKIRLVALGVAASAAFAVATVPYLSALAEFQLAKLGILPSDVPWATNSLTIRSQKTELAFEIAGRYPFFGAGAGRFGNEVGRLPGSSLVPAGNLVSVENAYAQMAAEHGVFALAVGLALFMSLAIQLMRSARRAEVSLLAFIAIGIVTQSSWTQSQIWVFLGYLAAVATARSMRGASRSESGSWGRPSTASDSFLSPVPFEGSRENRRGGTNRQQGGIARRAWRRGANAVHDSPAGPASAARLATSLESAESDRSR